MSDHETRFAAEVSLHLQRAHGWSHTQALAALPTIDDATQRLCITRSPAQVADLIADEAEKTDNEFRSVHT